MVVIGAECEDVRLQAFYVNNPSGWRAELQSGAYLSLERFAAATADVLLSDAAVSAPKVYITKNNFGGWLKTHLYNSFNA